MIAEFSVRLTNGTFSVDCMTCSKVYLHWTPDPEEGPPRSGGEVQAPRSNGTGEDNIWLRPLKQDISHVEMERTIADLHEVVLLQHEEDGSLHRYLFVSCMDTLKRERYADAIQLCKEFLVGKTEHQASELDAYMLFLYC